MNRIRCSKGWEKGGLEEQGKKRKMGGAILSLLL